GAVTGPAAATLPDAPTFDLFPAALHPMAHASATIAKDIRKPPNICAPLGAPLSPSFSPPLFDSAASLRVLLGDFTLSLFAKNHVRHANPKKIKREHGRHEHQHRGSSGVGVTIAATMVMTKMAYRKFFQSHCGVTMPKIESTKINTGS